MYFHDATTSASLHKFNQLYGVYTYHAELAMNDSINIAIISQYIIIHYDNIWLHNYHDTFDAFLFKSFGYFGVGHEAISHTNIEVST